MNGVKRVSPEESLVPYMRMARSYPLLDATTEVQLVRDWQERRDPAAGARLVGSYQRLVVKIASEYRVYGLLFSDLISEGNVGLMQAVEKFDVDRGFRLATYAMWWIRAAITDYVIRHSSVVRMVTNEHRKKLFFNLRRIKARLQTPDQGLLAPEAVQAIAEELGVPQADVEVMDQRLAARDVSVNAMVGEGFDTQWQDLLASGEDDQETKLIEADEHKKRRVCLENALAQLDSRERHILIERKLSDAPPKLSELGDRYGVSRERVRQIEARAFEKLRKLMLALDGQDPTPSTCGSLS